QLYRKSHAYHGIHPHYAWIWAAHAMEHAGDIIFVGADRDVVHRLGFKCATTLDDAFEMAEQTVGCYPSVTHLRTPPIMLADVAACHPCSALWLVTSSMAWYSGGTLSRITGVVGG